jgi:hypothetical protein
VKLKIIVFWNVPLYSLADRYQRFDYLENENNRFLRNVGNYLQDCTALYLRRAEDGDSGFLRKVEMLLAW